MGGKVSVSGNAARHGGNGARACTSTSMHPNAERLPVPDFQVSGQSCLDQRRHDTLPAHPAWRCKDSPIMIFDTLRDLPRRNRAGRSGGNRPNWLTESDQMCPVHLALHVGRIARYLERDVSSVPGHSKWAASALTVQTGGLEAIALQSGPLRNHYRPSRRCFDHTYSRRQLAKSGACTSR